MTFLSWLILQHKCSSGIYSRKCDNLALFACAHDCLDMKFLSVANDLIKIDSKCLIAKMLDVLHGGKIAI